MSLLFNMLSKFSIAFLPRNNTLEGISSTVTEAEELINDLEDRMVEITATEQNSKKKIRVKRNEDSPETSGTTLDTSTLQWSQEEERERKDLRKYVKS